MAGAKEKDVLCGHLDNGTDESAYPDYSRYIVNTHNRLVATRVASFATHLFLNSQTHDNASILDCKPTVLLLHTWLFSFGTVGNCSIMVQQYPWHWRIRQSALLITLTTVSEPLRILLCSPESPSLTTSWRYSLNPIILHFPEIASRRSHPSPQANPFPTILTILYKRVDIQYTT